MRNSVSVLGVLALLLLWLSSSLYTVDAREVAVVTLFGEPVQEIESAGLYVKAPWPIHDLRRYDARAQLLSLDATELLTRDKKNLVVEAFALWRVTEPRRFLENVQTPEAASMRLADLITSRIAAALGQVDFAALLSTERAGDDLLPVSVLSEVSAAATARFGIEVLDVRLQAVGLPLQNEQSIYDRMRAERSRTASRYRSEGEEQARGIRARADREAAELVAAARLSAASVRAGAEQEAAILYAEAYQQDPELYRLLRELETSRALLDGDATLILDATASPFSTLLDAER